MTLRLRSGRDAQHRVLTGAFAPKSKGRLKGVFLRNEPKLIGPQMRIGLTERQGLGAIARVTVLGFVTVPDGSDQGLGWMRT
jgi:hypothetical protein